MALLTLQELLEQNEAAIQSAMTAEEYKIGGSYKRSAILGDLRKTQEYYMSFYNSEEDLTKTLIELKKDKLSSGKNYVEFGA